ncbi:hypothetical protein AB4Z45_21810 [Paenibacillus sp. MCAF9]|uniref:hypothetical protein n=1 Tax=Paenibacillus sp. MCAF9 TaxID=3233046 RepID=UPI003F985776
MKKTSIDYIRERSERQKKRTQNIIDMAEIQLEDLKEFLKVLDEEKKGFPLKK